MAGERVQTLDTLKAVLEHKFAAKEAQAVDCNPDRTRKKMGVLPGAIVLSDEMHENFLRPSRELPWLAVDVDDFPVVASKDDVGRHYPSRRHVRRTRQSW